MRNCCVGLKAIIRSETYVPVFVAAGGHEKGVLPLLDAVINLMPSPAGSPGSRLPRARTVRRNSRPTTPVRWHFMSGKPQPTRLLAS